MSENNRRASTTVIAIALSTMLLAGCSPDKQRSNEDLPEPIVVGSLLALSGPDKSFGVTQQQGMSLALEEIENSGGIRGRSFRIEFADTQLDEDLGLQEFKRLSNKPEINAIVGITGSGVALRIAPFATQNQTVLLSSLDTSPKLTDASPFFFRNIASDTYSGIVLANWALSDDRTNAVLVYNSENAWARGCRDAVESAYSKAGGRLTQKPVAALDSTENFGPVIISFRQATPPPDAVFVCLMGRQAGLFVSQATSNQLYGPFFGSDPMSQQEFIDNARDGLEASFFVLPSEGQGEEYALFAQRYEERYGARADSIAAKAYDAVQMMAAAIGDLLDKQQALNGPNIQKSLSTIQITGITGENAFDENGDLEDPAFEKFTYKDRQRVTAGS